MVIEILVAEEQPEDALRSKLLYRVLNAALLSVVAKAAREGGQDFRSLLDLSKKQRAAVAGEIAAVEICNDFSASEASKGELLRGTVCLHGRRALLAAGVSQQQSGRGVRRPLPQLS